MPLDTLLDTALLQPADSLRYTIGAAMALEFPDRSVISSSDGHFNLEGYARAGFCSYEPDSKIFASMATRWHGYKRGVAEGIEDGFFHIRWRDAEIKVLFATWSFAYCRTRHYWIVSQDKQTATDFLEAVCNWDSQPENVVLVFDNGQWAKSPELYQSIKNSTFDNLVLPAAMRDQLQADFSDFFSSRSVYERYSVPWKRGVLFLGSPGNGKTHAVKSLINWLDKPCLYVKSFKTRYGNDHESIHAVFARARQTTPCLLIFEDLDSLIDDGNRSFFLNEMDGFETNTGVVVIATTNHPERLDSAILDRPSRFDRKYTFELPAETERLEYLSRWNVASQEEMRLSDERLQKIGKATAEFSFAYLKELTLSSMMAWIANSESGSMDSIMTKQVMTLRDQMKTSNDARLDMLPLISDQDDEE
jgi:hypothetical protein